MEGVFLRSLYTLNYRNLQSQTILFEKGVHAVIGNNGQGKTNLLEAVYLGLTGLTDARRLEHLVHQNAEQGYVRVVIERIDGQSVFEVGIGKGKRLLKLDGVRVKGGAFLRTGVVWIRPEDSAIVLEGPIHRRTYLDQLLGKISARYQGLQALYHRNLLQRNASLHMGSWALMEWNIRLAELGSEIQNFRRRVLLRLQEVAHQAYISLGGQEPLVFSLEETTTPETYLDDFIRLGEQERLRKTTLIGPHRDDLKIQLGNLSAHTFASRGEARTIALALRKAEFELLSEKNSEAPLLLVDDFTAELDPLRRSALLQMIQSSGQSLVTGTEAFPNPDVAFVLQSGSVSRVDHVSA